MNKKIVLVRHGKAGPNVPSDDGTDDGLVMVGRQQIQLAANWLRERGLGRVQICTSPTRRTRESAQIIGVVLGVTREIRVCPYIAEHRLNYSIEEFREMMEVLDQDDNVDTVVLVTHSPDKAVFRKVWGDLWGLSQLPFSPGSALLLYPDGQAQKFQPVGVGAQ